MSPSSAMGRRPVPYRAEPPVICLCLPQCAVAARARSGPRSRQAGSFGAPFAHQRTGSARGEPGLTPPGAGAGAGDRGLPGRVQPVRLGALPPVTPVLELVDVEVDALALAGSFVTPALAVPVVPVALRLHAPRAGCGADGSVFAHLELPSGHPGGTRAACPSCHRHPGGG